MHYEIPLTADINLAKTVAKAEKLAGPGQDPKLKRLMDHLKELTAAGFQPVVFCRYIATAHYVAENLRKEFRNHEVKAVTGEFAASEREAAVEAMGESDNRILVATDCLSEGVNLQEGFQAVLHYDLAWNPTRHEQREGRVDRFGQQRDVVRAITLYGQDNRIDGIVLDVLLRKHEAIRKATGVSVPVPETRKGLSSSVVLMVQSCKGRSSGMRQLWTPSRG